MPEPEQSWIGDDEVAALREAVSPEVLRKAARSAPGAWGDLLHDLADALEADEPASAVAQVVSTAWGSTPTDPEAARDAVDRLMKGLLPLADQAERSARDAAAHRSTLAEHQVQLREAAEAESTRGEPHLAEALETLGDPTLLERLGGVLTDADGAVQAVAGILRRSAGGRPASAEELRAVTAQLKGLRARAEAADPTERLLQALQLVRKRLAEDDDPRAADLALLEAALRQSSTDRIDPSTALPLFEEALAIAERHGVLRVAQDAARALQADALRRDDFARVAELARRVTAIADAEGEYRPRVLARLEEAMAVARAGDPTRGFDLADQTEDLAAAFHIPELVGRARLAKGQILEQLGEPRRAIRAYEPIVRDLSDASSDVERSVAGQALMGIARCMTPGPERLATWRRVQRVGVELHNFALYLRATIGAVEELAAADDREAAVTELFEGRRLAGQVVGPTAEKPFDECAERLEAQWGKDAFHHQMQVLRERLRSGPG